MKKFLPILPVAAALTYLSLTSSSSGITGQSTVGCGTPSCHGGSANSATVISISSNIPGTGWVSGTTYTITATVSNTSTSQTAAGFNLSTSTGTLSSAPAGALISGSEIRHTTPKSFTSQSASWSFSWTAPASTSTATSVTFNMAGNAVNQNGQSTGDIWNTGSATFQRAAAPPPVPNVVATGSTTRCGNQAFPVLTALSAGATSFQWYNGTSLISGATGANYTPTANGVFTATASNSAGTSAASNAITVTSVVKPSAVFTFSLVSGSNYQFNYPTAGLQYLWTFGTGGPTSTAQNPTFNFTTPGPKAVKLRVTQPGTTCADSTTQTITVQANVDGPVAALGVQVWPNPATEVLNIRTGSLRARVRLLSVTGAVVAVVRDAEETSAEKSFSLARIPAGIYALEVVADGQRAMQKLVVR